MQIKTLILIVCTLRLVGWVVPAFAGEGREGEPRDLPRRGTVTVSYAYATDSAGPSTRGPRIGYGYAGGPKKDYPWGELWATFREDGGSDITAAGLSVVPVSKQSRRFDVGPLLTLGVSRRREGNGSDLDALIGGGLEGVMKPFRRWVLVITGEAVYRVASDLEVQVRIGIRFHHEKLPPFGGGS